MVEFTIEKGDGSKFSPEVGGVPRSTATLRVTESLLYVLILSSCIVTLYHQICVQVVRKEYIAMLIFIILCLLAVVQIISLQQKCCRVGFVVLL